MEDIGEMLRVESPETYLTQPGNFVLYHNFWFLDVGSLFSDFNITGLNPTISCPDFAVTE
jgi:hypothetical protein